MGAVAPAPKVPTVGQETHPTLRPHLWDTKQVSWSLEEGDAHQPWRIWGCFLEEEAHENWDSTQ